MSLNKNEIIQRAQKGDAEAFSVLMEDYARRIYALALHYTRDAFEAEDLAQEVWLKAYNSMKGFRGDSSFYTWLRHILVNTFLNHQRARTATPELSLDDSNQESGTAFGPRILEIADRGEAEENVQRKIMVDTVMRALGELTPQERLVFLLKHREGMTYLEISNAFGCSVGTIKKSLFRAMTKLRSQFEIKEAQLEFVECSAGRNR